MTLANISTQHDRYSLQEGGTSYSLRGCLWQGIDKPVIIGANFFSLKHIPSSSYRHIFGNVKMVKGYMALVKYKFFKRIQVALMNLVDLVLLICRQLQF